MSTTQHRGNSPASGVSLPLCMPPDAERDGSSTWQQLTTVNLPGRSFLQEDPSDEDDEDEVPRIKISILMCAFNEEQTIRRAAREVLRQEYPCEIELIVVDDGSSDATADLVARVKDPRLILHRHAQNRGKGAALRTAASLATGTHILPFDADLEYLPKDIPRLIEPLLSGQFEVVYGARLFGYNTVYQSFRYAVGNRVLTMLTNILFDSYLSDMHTCLKLIPLETFKNLTLRENGFGLDTEVTVTLLRLGIRPFEVPISYYSRSHAQGKKINWRDALACLSIMLKVRVKRKRRLTAASPAVADTQDEAQLRPKAGQTSLSTGLALLAAFDAGERASEEPNAVAAG